MKRKTPYFLALVALALAVLIVLLPKMARVPTGYTAKVTCSELFLANREFANVISADFDNISPAFDWIKLHVNSENKSVESTLFGLGKSVAIYRDDIGCTLAGKNGLTAIERQQSTSQNPHIYSTTIDSDVQNAVLRLFDDSQSSRPIKTRAVVVIQHGNVVAEQYAAGFDKNVRQQSWSTAKGVMQALVGIAVHKGYLSLRDSKLMPVWQGDDPRSTITIGHLLQMASGLEFNESYTNPLSDVDQMLFNQDDMGSYAADHKLVHEPGTVSTYSSGTTNIVSSILRQKLQEKSVNYHEFPYRELFNKLSMSSAVFEVDASGHYIGSSYLYATPRDFARFGQLYLQNGVWRNEQILPTDWVAYTGQEAPQSAGKYGSHWSLNVDQSVLPGLPVDVIHLGGNDGQMIVVIPSKAAVIVRMGITRPPASTEDDVYPLIRAVYENLK